MMHGPTNIKKVNVGYTDNLKTIQLVSYYAKCRRYLRCCKHRNFYFAETMDLVKGLNRRGVYVGIQHITDPQFAALAIPRHRLGAVILIPCQISSVEEEFMEQVNMFIPSVSNMQTRSSDGPQYSANVPICKGF